MSGPATARTAAMRPASSPTAALSLIARNPACAGRGGFGRGACAVGCGDRGVDLDLWGGLRAEQVPHGQAGSAAREVPQREVDRGDRMG